MFVYYVRAGAAAIVLFLNAAVLAQQPQPLPDAPTSSTPDRSQPAANRPPRVLPGQRADGSVLLPNQWSLRPAGRQIELGDYPVNIALHPGGCYAAVLHCGHGRHQVKIVDLRQETVVASAPIREAFYGIEFSARGDRLFCSGAGDEVIHVFRFQDGKLRAEPDVPLRNPAQRGIPCGLAVSRDGSTLYAANVWGQCVSVATAATRTNLFDLVLDKAAGSVATFGPRKTVNDDLLAATKRALAPLDPADPEAPFPYACRLDEKRRRLYVSLWAQSCVAVLEASPTAPLRALARWPVGDHPNEMLLSRSGRYLFVANANRNSVTILDTETGKTVETLEASLAPNSLPGTTPNSLALSPDETTLFIANARNNNIAVFDVKTPGRSRSLGFIPVGWQPTSVRVTADGRKLLVANGRGVAPKPNPGGPQPGRNQRAPQDIKDLFRGTLSFIDLPQSDAAFQAQLAAWTAQAQQCSPRPAVIPDLARNPIPSRSGQPSPIKYCIYVIKENRTYDQVLGDLPQGNGDPNLCLFPRAVTPNQHQLACDFVLLDNFYAEAEVSAQGHEWSMGAYCSDFVERSWPLSYGHNQTGKYPYPAEGNFPIASPANGYLWDRALQAGVSYRSYGEFVQNGKKDTDPAQTRVAALQGHFDPRYRCFDLNYSDLKRAQRFIDELHRFEKEGGLPRLQIVRLGNDHTCGSLAGKLTPRAFVAENDRALGMLVEAVSHSKFWPETAIFVVEDDAQNGPDHVDAHRTTAFVISPYTRRGIVDSTFYSTSSMLRTIELILGLAPMSQFDAAAAPMFNAFAPTPDERPFEAVPAGVDLTERSSKLAWGSRASDKMDFSKEDAADDLLLNEIVWRNVRGPDQPMPAPVRAAFVRVAAKGDPDDD